MKKRVILATTGVLLLSGLTFWYFTPSSAYKPKYTPPVAEPAPMPVYTGPPEPQVSDIDVTKMLVLTNEYRVTKGVAKLTISQALNDSASEKCSDMVTRDYWSHDSPDGTKPWDIIKKYIPYVMAGENLSFGYNSADSVITGWIHSPEHEKNLANASFEYVGFGVCKSDSYIKGGPRVIIVQHFAQV